MSGYKFFGLAQLLAILLITLYLAFGITSTTMGFAEWVLHAAPSFYVAVAVLRWLQKFDIDPERENVLGIGGVILFFAASPAFVLGLFYAFVRARVAYNVTRKGPAGGRDTSKPSLRILILYLALAGISLAGLIVSPFSGFNFPPMVFWAAFNLFTMTVVVLTMWHPAIPVPARLRLLSLRRAFPISMATATTAIVLLAAFNAPSVLSISPYGNFTASTKYISTLEPVEAQSLQPDSRRVAIGAVANSGDELEAVAKISHIFVNWRPDQLEKVVDGIRQATQDGQLSMVTWQHALTATRNKSLTRPERAILKRILSGEFDSYVARVATILKQTKQPILLRFAHEMENEAGHQHHQVRRVF